ncbi:CGNR zinc finger domain-containing protein [Nonomuraea sp. NPDC050556]|uniref:CGNR zinc finger domain-containing protein n=1 Tax=Nonomuraea sp. NPDC050556 TaxID=3364369 RepID=UPI00379EFB47
MRARPLLGEPLPLDLVDTLWNDHGTQVDYFDDEGAAESWLAEHGLPGQEDHLVETRQALRAALQGDEAPLDAVLEHGSVRPGLRGERVIVDDPSWHAAWVVAADFVRLMGERPDRVRKCANPECLLWFLDISKNGSRRWCSMEKCGNRAKVGRFHQRHRKDHD